MKNFITWVIIIVLIILISLISLLAGIYIGKDHLSGEKIQVSQKEAVAEFAEKVKELPILNKIPSLPENQLYGTIKSIKGQSIEIETELQTVDDILNNAQNTFTITVKPNTKIYYLKMNEQIAFNNVEDINDLITETKLSLTDLKANEQVSIIIDPLDRNKPIIEAKQIKVNR